MPCRTTRELLNQIRDFHRQLGHFYSQTAGRAERRQVKALLEYLGRHEERLEAELGAYEKDVAKKVLDTWFEFMPDIARCECFDDIELSADMSVDEVMRVALWFDECLVRFIRAMADLAVSTDVRDLFTGLVEVEQQEERRLTRVFLELTEDE